MTVSVAHLSIPHELMLPLGTRRAAPTDVEMRTWLHCTGSASEHGQDMYGLRGPYWYVRANEDDDGVRGVCRRFDGGFGIYLRCGNPRLMWTVYHELGHAFDAEWETDFEGREARANAFAYLAMGWRR